jgi:DcuC family C4-dicarboxylate transporter
MTLWGGLAIIGLVVFAVARRAEVRLTLLLAALALGCLAGQPQVIVRTFLEYFTREQFLVPIGCSLGFVYVLRNTGCDQHLVQLLAAPLRRTRVLLIPGVVAVAAIVNVPVISQTSAAVLAGSVLIPLLRAARISAVTTGAALLLGASIGGELLNPGAPELRTIADATGARTEEIVRHVLPLLLVELAVATLLFWVISLRAEARQAKDATSHEDEPAPPGFRVNLLKAAVPLVPLVLLFLTSLPPPLRAWEVPQDWLVSRNVKWLVDGKDRTEEMLRGAYDSRLIGAAMLIGTAIAALTDIRRAGQTAKAFFEGAGYALTHITSLIVAASCFSEGVKLTGLAKALGGLLEHHPGLLRPAAMTLPLAFAVLCGSGMAATQSLYSLFLPAVKTLGADPLQIGATVSLAAAAGRTMSPVAAVVLMCSSLSGAEPLALVRRVAAPLLAANLAALVVSWMLSIP